MLDNYRNQTGITYPILMNGYTGGVRAAYECEAAFVFVIGGDGIILYRGFYDDVALRATIDAGLAALAPSPVARVEPVGHSFGGAFPNPFNPSTRLSFSLAPHSTSQAARLEIVDLQGRLVAVLLDETATAGRRYETVWNGQDTAGRQVASGTYLARLQIGTWQATKALTLIK